MVEIVCRKAQQKVKYELFKCNVEIFDAFKTKFIEFVNVYVNPLTIFHFLHLNNMTSISNFQKTKLLDQYSISTLFDTSIIYSTKSFFYPFV